MSVFGVAIPWPVGGDEFIILLPNLKNHEDAGPGC